MLNQQPTPAFVFASWAALFIGSIAYLIGLWNADMVLSEKGYYFTILMFGLFGAVSVQKSVRDRMEDIPVSNIYYGISWLATLLPIALLVIGLWNATMLLSEKGFYGMAFMMSIFAAIVVQKNTRDSQVFEKQRIQSRMPRNLSKRSDDAIKPRDVTSPNKTKVSDKEDRVSEAQPKVASKPNLA